MDKHATYSSITDETIRGSYGTVVFTADKLPQNKHGMEQWKLVWRAGEKPLDQMIVKCTVGKGAEEARAILQEFAAYWSRISGRSGRTSYSPHKTS